MKKYIIFSILFVLSAWLAFLPSFAENGDGTGGGKNEPLALLSSSPANGQTDVTLNAQIVMGFSKNVINMTVRDNNMKCFALYNEKGEAVPIKVLMADDQIEPEKKREVIIAPEENLKEGTRYQVKISASLQSKSGVTLKNDVFINFTTVADKAEKVTVNQNDAESKLQTTKTRIKSAVQLQNSESMSSTQNKYDVKATDGVVEKSNKVTYEAVNVTPAAEQDSNTETAVQNNLVRDDFQNKPMGLYALVIAVLLYSIGFIIYRKLKK